MPYKILALSNIPTEENGSLGYMDDGSDSYKDFLFKDGKLHILHKFPKSEYGDERMFGEIMGKWVPETFFIENPPTISEMSIKILSEIYWNNYVG